MIRRLLLVLALAIAALVATAGSAGAADVACLYKGQPLHRGLCISVSL